MEYSIKVVNLAAGTSSDSFQEAKEVLAMMTREDPNFTFSDVGEVFVHIELDDPDVQQILWFCGPLSPDGCKPEAQSKTLDSLESLVYYCLGKWDESPIEHNDGLMDSKGRTYVATEAKPELLEILAEYYEDTPVTHVGCMSIAAIEVDDVSFETN